MKQATARSSRQARQHTTRRQNSEEERGRERRGRDGSNGGHRRPAERFESPGGMISLLQPSAWPALAMTAEFAKLWTSVGAELLDMQRQRIDKVRTAADQFSHARDLGEVLDLQVGYTRELVHDYVAGSGRAVDALTGSVGKAVTSTGRMLQHQSEMAEDYMESASDEGAVEEEEEQRRAE